MENGESSWKAPESSLGDKNKILVTGRSWETLYKPLYVQDSDFVEKTTVSLGNGLSNFPEHVNKLSKDTHCYGIDPLYSFLGQTYDEFLKNLKEHNLEPNRLIDEEAYEKFKKGMGAGTYIAATGEHLPFEDTSIDTVVTSEMIANIGDQRVILKIIDEILRVLKPDGEVRTSDLTMPVFNDGRMSLEIEKYYIPLNDKKPEDWFEILRYLQSNGCNIFSVKSQRGAKLHEAISGRGFRTIPAYKGFIIRKDNVVPRVTYIHTQTEPDSNAKEEQSVIQLDAIHSESPSAIKYSLVRANVLHVSKKEDH